MYVKTPSLNRVTSVKRSGLPRSFVRSGRRRSDGPKFKVEVVNDSEWNPSNELER